MPYYLIHNKVGLDKVISEGDGSSITLKWFTAYPNNVNNKIAYNIYYSTENDNVFYEGPKFICSNGTSATIRDLTPGQLYYFSVRPVEYSLPATFSTLPAIYSNLQIYSTSVLRSPVAVADMIVQILDASDFPTQGMIRIGSEVMRYSGIQVNDLLISQRGLFNSEIRDHSVDGYDGFNYLDPKVTFYVAGETNIYDRIFISQSRFEYPNYQATLTDGYHQITKDLLTSDMSTSDELNKDFPVYDYAGYHRTDPVKLVSGSCIGSYIGGEMYCADGYSGVGRVVRGISLQDRNLQRQEMLLTVTGEPVVLFQRQRTGITCACYQPSSQYPDDRCPQCMGSGIVQGYTQYFNSRRSDGRIMIRFSPANEEVKMQDGGLESELNTDAWTLTVPTIKSRDIIVRFQDGNEEFRYEVMNVNRNRTFLSQQGAQKIQLKRIRKYDPDYQIKVFRDTSSMPRKISTTIGFVPGIIPHAHMITANELDPTQWSQMSSQEQGHNHVVQLVNGILTVMPTLGHTHGLIL